MNITHQLISQSNFGQQAFCEVVSLIENDEDKLLSLICQVRPSCEELVSDVTRPLPRGELAAQKCPPAGGLKLMVHCALRVAYFIMDMQICLSVEWSRVQKGLGKRLQIGLGYKGGNNDWTADYECRAKNDDGERMMGCDCLPCFASHKVHQHRG